MEYIWGRLICGPVFVLQRMEREALKAESGPSNLLPLLWHGSRKRSQRAPTNARKWAKRRDAVWEAEGSPLRVGGRGRGLGTAGRSLCKGGRCQGVGGWASRSSGEGRPQIEFREKRKGRQASHKPRSLPYPTAPSPLPRLRRRPLALLPTTFQPRLSPSCRPRGRAFAQERAPRMDGLPWKWRRGLSLGGQRSQGQGALVGWEQGHSPDPPKEPFLFQFLSRPCPVAHWAYSLISSTLSVTACCWLLEFSCRTSRLFSSGPMFLLLAASGNG